MKPTRKIMNPNYNYQKLINVYFLNEKGDDKYKYNITKTVN